MTGLLAQLPTPPAGRTGWPWTEETPPSAYAGQSDWPRVSLVTPSYNQAAYLEETIRSVLLQNYPNLQYLVIDGGSSDDSPAIIKRYAPWLSHWESERDRGQSHAINKGLARCDGEWFNWINSDDCLLPGALAAVAAAAQTGAHLISGAEITGADLSQPVPLGRTKIAATLEETLVGHFVCQQGLFFRTALVRELGGVREDLHYVMDLELLARCLLREGLAGVREIPATLAFFRRHAAAKTSAATGKFFAEERRLFQGLAHAAGVDDEVARRIAADRPLPVPPEAAARLDRDRLSRLLAAKYWWDETVEVAWRERRFAAFKREARQFLARFPAGEDRRRSRLHFLSRLPEPALRLLSFFRISSRP